MRISRKKRPKKPLIPHYNINGQIKSEEVRVVGDEGENLGVISTKEAMEKAQEQEVDLIEINPKARPPVVMFKDFSHFKYQKEKEARKQKAKSHVSELKGVRLSIRIGEHDLKIRRKQAEKFLNRGDKVKIELILRGRDRAQSHIAYEVVKEFAESIKESIDIRFEQEPTRQGSRVNAIIAKA